MLISYLFINTRHKDQEASSTVGKSTNGGPRATFCNGGLHPRLYADDT